MRSSASLADSSLVLVGAGHSNISLIRRFAMEPLDHVRLVVIHPDSTAPYSGMLPGYLAGQYSLDDLFIDIAALCKQAGAHLIRGSLERIDAETKTLHISHQASFDPKTLSVHYDYAVLNTGAAPAKSFPVSHPDCHYVKPIRNLLADLPRIDSVLSEAHRSLVIVGGGAAGIELAFAFRARFGAEVSITLVSKHPIDRDQALKAGATRIRKALAIRTITLLEEVEVTEATDVSVTLSTGASLKAHVVCIATPVTPPQWIEASGLASGDQFLTVDSNLRVVGCDGLYAAGDIINLTSQRGRSGVMAVRAGQYLAESLWRLIQGRSASPFRPQKNWLTLLNLGDGEAIGIKGVLSYQGQSLFQLKDRIDRNFMARFKFNAMNSQDEMRCEGCAAKLPGGTLTSIFGSQFEDGAITVHQGASRIRSVDALSYLINDPYLVGMLTMRHAVSDIWAMGARPTTALTVVAVERALSKRLEAQELSHAVAGLQDAAMRYEVDIIGGHSLALEQPMIAVAIEGECQTPMKKVGAKIGDEIWLTGPIGSGVLFAALASAHEVGSSIDQWLVSALRSLFDASQIAIREGVHAMTDVTGYGVAGHLKEMLHESEITVRWAEHIHSFASVDACVAQGIQSTAYLDNRSYAGAIGYGAPNPILFDPQTCGPLMIAAPSAIARKVIKQWSAIGLSPQCVGTLTTETS